MHARTIESPRDKFVSYWESQFMNEPYYDAKYAWEDFDPAYQYAYDMHAQYPDRDFDDIEDSLAEGWKRARGRSRLGWEEAKRAVRSGWHSIELALPGDFDGDGR